MKKGERLHDFFYEAVRKASDYPLGQKALSGMAPLLKKILPRETVTRSAQEIFEELGYSPDVFNSVLSTPVRVYEHNLKGLLSCSAHHKITQISKYFSDEMPASAIMSYQKPSSPEKNINYIILAETKVSDQSYRREISDMSGLPESIIERLEGSGRLSKAITLGHEMSHFEMDATFSNDAARYVEIESFCDAMPLIAFQKVSEPEAFNATQKEMILARAIHPLVNATEKDRHDVQLTFADSVYGHATALLLDNPELLDNDSPGQVVIDAYKSAKASIDPVVQSLTDMPSIFACYCASKEILEKSPPQEPHARRVLELYVEGIEYFSPSYAAKALKKFEATGIGATIHAEHCTQPADLSLEIS